MSREEFLTNRLRERGVELEALREEYNELMESRDSALKFIGDLGAELVNTGMPAGDRTVILANVRQLISAKRSWWNQAIEQAALRAESVYRCSSSATIERDMANRLCPRIAQDIRTLKDERA